MDNHSDILAADTGRRRNMKVLSKLCPLRSVNTIGSASALHQVHMNTIPTTCANCCRTFSTPLGEVLGVGTYIVGDSGPTRTVFEGFQLLFKSRQSLTSKELTETLNDLKLCLPCATQFQNLMSCHTTFLRSSKPGSYVFNLQKEVSQHFQTRSEIPVECIKAEANPQPKQYYAQGSVQVDTVFTLGPPPFHIEVQDLDDNLVFKPEIIIPELQENSVDDVALNVETSENFVDNSGYFLTDPLSISSNSTAIIPSSSTPITYDFGPSIIAVPNIPVVQPIRGRKLKLENRCDVTPGASDGNFGDICSPNVFCNPLGSEQIKSIPLLTSTNSTLKRAAVTTPKMSRASPPNDTLAFPCFDCEASFATKKQLNRHSRSKHGAPYARIPTDSKIELTKEQKALVDFKKFLCDTPECNGMVFGSFRDWVLHQEKDHKLDTGYKDALEKSDFLVPKYKKMRPCPMCGLKRDTDTRIIQHLKNFHFNDHEYACDVCDKTLSSKIALANHVKTFHSETPMSKDFLCTYCGDSFLSKATLSLHEGTHLDLIQKKEKKFGCDICEKRFDTKSQLQRHKFSHVEERNFACDQCDGTFKSQKVLTSHKSRQHYKRFILDEVCELCGKKYAFKNVLKEHLMSVHKMNKEEARISAKIKRPSIFRVLPNGDRIFKEQPTKPKTCSICDRTYTRRENLFTHLISVHGKNEEEAKELTGLETKRNLIQKNFSTKTRGSRKVAKLSTKRIITSKNDSEDTTEDDDDGNMEDEDEEKN